MRVAPAHEGRDIAIAVKFGIVPEGTTVAGFQILLQRPEIAKRFQSARKAYYADLARRSVAARRKAKKAVDEAEAAEAELGEAV